MCDRWLRCKHLDETDGTAIRVSRRSASVKSVKGKRIATQEDLETSRSSSPSNSYSFTDEEEALSELDSDNES
jgi:hypothetical protein